MNLLNSVRHINIIFYSSEISNIDKLTSNFNLFIDLAQKNIKQSLELVSWYLYYFQEENKSSILSPLLSTANLLKQIIKKTNRFLTDIIIKLIKEDPNFINSWYERKIPIEQWGINEIDRLYLQPKARLYDSKIDQYKEHLPYPRNQYVLENGQLASASIIDLTPLAKVPFKMIASQGPMKSTIEIFWSMVEESQSNCIAMVTDLLENEGHSSEKKKCEQYWPTNVGEDLAISNDKKIIYQNRTIIENVGEEQLIHSTFILITKSEERVIHHYWLIRLERWKRFFKLCFEKSVAR
ncbi:MAG: hypothetical protein BGO10_06580 [Chlamydia sp. 32-24]|nr:MAG: hypothetical protein BGO10_06580 [Chlamydia sp. 32-24]